LDNIPIKEKDELLNMFVKKDEKPETKLPIVGENKFANDN
jgi:hypothetical protein